MKDSSEKIMLDEYFFRYDFDSEDSALTSQLTELDVNDVCFDDAAIASNAVLGFTNSPNIMLGIDIYVKRQIAVQFHA